MSSTLQQWERAERERSAFEASHFDAPNLKADPKDVARYFNPPANTVHPLEYAFNLLGDLRGKTVLEYGCGDGINTILLANRGAKIISLDLSPELIDLARKRVVANGLSSGVEFIVGSAHNVPLPDESVDVVVGIAILHHLDLFLASREVNRVLRKGGMAVFQEPVRNSKLMGLIRKLIPNRSPDISPFERPLTDRELLDFSAGYSSYHCRPFHTIPSSLLYHLLPFLRKYTTIPSLRFDAAMLERFPALGYYSAVKVFKVVR
jgi:ubiquinone/menaquinone biosynthesis C-methylase UbiE